MHREDPTFVLEPLARLRPNYLASQEVGRAETVIEMSTSIPNSVLRKVLSMYRDK